MQGEHLSHCFYSCFWFWSNIWTVFYFDTLLNYWGNKALLLIGINLKYFLCISRLTWRKKKNMSGLNEQFPIDILKVPKTKISAVSCSMKYSGLIWFSDNELYDLKINSLFNKQGVSVGSRTGVSFSLSVNAVTKMADYLLCWLLLHSSAFFFCITLLHLTSNDS